MKILVANWKMNGTIDLCREFLPMLNAAKFPESLVICPPYPLLHCFKDKKFKLGAQNCGLKSCGAYTGEVSPVLLKEIGCSYVIIGHSERRISFHESNADIFEKFKLLCELGIKPIVCIGEKLEEKTNYKQVLSEQLRYFLDYGDLLSNCIFAYEPVWSIGTNIIPSLSEIEEITSFIKQKTMSQVLYGGSVNDKNIKDILNIPSLDGVLIGGASLKLKEFSLIIQSAELLKN